MINCKVFLTHYLPLTERLVIMESQLRRHGIEYEIISDEPSSNWPIDSIESRINKTASFHNFSGKPVTLQESSLLWKHLICLNKASELDVPSLVLEDDAMLSDDFSSAVSKILETPGWDMVFPGSGCNLRAKGSGLVRVPHPASKCTDSYLVTPYAAKRLTETMNLSVDLPIDWELNYQMKHHDLRVFWLEPPIVRQGSQDGTMRSSINGKLENILTGN